MSARKEKKADLTLDPPAFTLEKNNPDLEIFTFRLPSTIPLNSLDQLELDLSGSATAKPCRFQSGGAKYNLQLGTAVENESFRVLLPKAKAAKKDKDDSDDDDSDDDDDDDKHLQPATIPFTRHFNVVAATTALTERTLAPRQDKAPVAVDPMRRAYQHVPQITGLKRRWMPLGVPAAPAEQLNTTTKGQNGKKSTSTPSNNNSKENNNGSSSSDANNKPKRIKLADTDGDAASSSLLKADNKKSSKKDKDRKKSAKKDKKEAKKKRKNSVEE
jgi:hypothetical protein